MSDEQKMDATVSVAVCKYAARDTLAAVDDGWCPWCFLPFADHETFALPLSATTSDGIQAVAPKESSESGFGGGSV